MQCNYTIKKRVSASVLMKIYEFQTIHNVLQCLFYQPIQVLNQVSQVKQITYQCDLISPTTLCINILYLHIIRLSLLILHITYKLLTLLYIFIQSTPSRLTNPGEHKITKYMPAVLFTYIWGPTQCYTILLFKQN